MCTCVGHHERERDREAACCGTEQGHTGNQGMSALNVVGLKVGPAGVTAVDRSVAGHAGFRPLAQNRNDNQEDEHQSTKP